MPPHRPPGRLPLMDIGQGRRFYFSTLQRTLVSVTMFYVCGRRYVYGIRGVRSGQSFQKTSALRTQIDRWWW